MIELLTAFILYTYGAHWIWWLMFIIAILGDGIYNNYIGSGKYK